MRFLILTQYFPPEIGAVPSRLAAFVKTLKAAGHEVVVATALPNYPEGRIFPGYRGRLLVHERMDGTSVHRVLLYPAVGAGLARMLNYASFSATAPLALLFARRPDYVFIESPPLSLAVAGVAAGRRWGAKVILNVADLWPDSIAQLGLLEGSMLLRLLYRLEGWAYRRADYVTAATEGIAAALQAKGVALDKLLFLPNGIDTDMFRPRQRDRDALTRHGICTDWPVAMYAGTMGYVHGAEVALEAMRVLEDRGVMLRLVLIGGGSERLSLKERARALGLRNVIFVDPVPPAELAEMWAGVDVGLSTLKDLPLSDGARPSKVYPAMASGVPIVYSGAGEGARLVAEADSGCVVAPGDHDALARALETLITDAELAARLGANGRRYVEKHLTWDRVVGDWLAQLSEREVRRERGR